jgi:glutathione peroxidase
VIGWHQVNIVESKLLIGNVNLMFNAILVFLFMIITTNVYSNTSSTNAHDFKFKSIEGDVLKLSDYKNKVLLVVNTASRCGFTTQYTALQKLWDEYKNRGLVVIGVPSGDFGNQELSTDEKIKDFCEVNFDINFPMTTRSHVKGSKAHAFYKWANKQVGFTGTPRWNFHKFLIGPEGRLIDWFASTTKPSSIKVKSKIEQQLSLIK